MTRDEALIRAALAMAARLCNPPDQSEAARLTEFAAGCRHTMIRLEAAIRAIDPAEVLEKVGEVETTAGPWALDTSTGSEILVKGGCSVIEGEDARYLLRLIAADTSTPAPDAVARLVEAARQRDGGTHDPRRRHRRASSSASLIGRATVAPSADGGSAPPARPNSTTNAHW